MKNIEFPCIRGKPDSAIIRWQHLLIRCRLPGKDPNTFPRGDPRSGSSPAQTTGSLRELRERRYCQVPSG